MARRAARARVRRTSGSLALTRRGVVTLVAAALLLLAAPRLSLPALTQVGALLLGLVMASVVFALVAHTRVSIVRHFAHGVVDPGERVRIELRVTNRGRLPSLEATWADALPRGVAGEARGVVLPLGGRRSASSRRVLGYEVFGVRRGRHAIGPVRISVVDPFGLARRQQALGEAEMLTVLPRRVDLRPIAVGGSSLEGLTKAAPQNGGLGDDDVLARAYQPGDAVKRLHWKATAHRGELMVRQEEQQVAPRAVVLLDSAAGRHGTVPDLGTSWGQAPGFEWCVMAAASIVEHLADAGYVVHVRSSDGILDRVVAEGEDALEDVMVDLAVLQPRDDDDRGIDDVAEPLTIVLLGRPDEATVREWGSALPVDAYAFVAAGTSPSALAELDRAGWHHVVYGVSDELVDLWAALEHGHADAAR